MSLIFDPNAGSGSTLVATSTAQYTAVREAFAADQAEREQEQRERAMRSLGFGSRSSLCG